MLNRHSNKLREICAVAGTLIIDVRNSFGGSGEFNRTLVTSIIRNESLNRHDRTFVLIGRRTFSAAQLLVNELEQYTRVSVVRRGLGLSCQIRATGCSTIAFRRNVMLGVMIAVLAVVVTVVFVLTRRK